MQSNSKSEHKLNGSYGYLDIHKYQRNPYNSMFSHWTYIKLAKISACLLDKQILSKLIVLFVSWGQVGRGTGALVHTDHFALHYVMQKRCCVAVAETTTTNRRLTAVPKILSHGECQTHPIQNSHCEKFKKIL